MSRRIQKSHIFSFLRIQCHFPDHQWCIVIPDCNGNTCFQIIQVPKMWEAHEKCRVEMGEGRKQSSGCECEEAGPLCCVKSEPRVKFYLLHSETSPWFSPCFTYLLGSWKPTWLMEVVYTHSGEYRKQSFRRVRIEDKKQAQISLRFSLLCSDPPFTNCSF